MESQVLHLSQIYMDILSLTNNSLTMNNSTNSTIPDWSDPYIQASLVCIVTGLIFGLIIMLVKRLHTQTTGNNAFIVLTVIMLTSYYVMIRLPGYFSSLYVSFIIFYEFTTLTVIILSCSIYYMHKKQMNNTTSQQ
ncbi:hypothetical protein MN116_007573 [Schistosoma mekongi]|uniref:Uncharacterized protein n=1 Tax=Schistosoma mekongi TaxID=38744 RepID=A0AAE1Z766_SCHME|nr:hypothetical protein MN116_007573 [Schistosoma mekongi]